MDTGFQRVKYLRYTIALPLKKIFAKADSAGVLAVHIASIKILIKGVLNADALSSEPTCHPGRLPHKSHNFNVFRTPEIERSAP
jgi:hypothetical protein